MTTVTATVSCHRCKKQVLLSKCWAVHDKGLKTFECKDTKCATLPPKHPWERGIFPFEYVISKPLARKNTTFYYQSRSQLIWKYTITESWLCWKQPVVKWERATEEETEYLMPYFDQWNMAASTLE